MTPHMSLAPEFETYAPDLSEEPFAPLIIHELTRR